jgi:4-amino-4-deoxy-L-arabinose transferase-like glycosyltransferase
MTAAPSSSFESVPAHERAPQARPNAVEWWLVAAISLAGLAARCARPAALAVEHFDEGVYASNIFFSGEEGRDRYPDQHLYAPPLLPHLVEWTMVALGPSNLAAMVPGIVAGSLTVPLVWWVGRRWIGPTAGLASATVVALNDAHIFFSRTALTDVLLCLWVVAAVYLFWEAQVTRSRLALVAAGAVTGLAWWTKYSGWLPLAIGLAGVVPWRMADVRGAMRPGQSSRPSNSDSVRLLAGAMLRWGVVAAIALLVWSPWLWSLQGKGGYAAVMKNHRGYMVGLAGWFPSLCSQAAKIRSLDGPFTTVALPVALALCAAYFKKASRSRFTWNCLLSNRTLLLAVAATCLSWAFLGSAVGSLLFAAAGLLAVGVSRRPVCEGGHDSPRVSLAIWLLAAWFLGLMATTPLYTPYPRLALPLLMACWLCVGLTVGAFCDRICSVSERLHRDITPAGRDLPAGTASSPSAAANGRVSLALALLAVLLLANAISTPRGVPGWQSRTGLAELAPVIIDDARDSVGVSRESGLDKFAISTYADPGLLFQLRLAGVGLVTPLSNLNFARPDAPPPPLPRFVVIGPVARRTAGFEEQFSAARPRLELVQTYQISPSDLVLLDQGPIPKRRPVEELELYRLK